MPGLQKRGAMKLVQSPHILFRPSPALQGFMGDESRRILVRAANRTGKTQHAAARLVRRMLEHPGYRARAVGPTRESTRDVVEAALARLIPAGALETGCAWSPVQGWGHRLIRLKNGSTCQIRSGDQHPNAHAGESLDEVWLDEPPREAILEENVARVFDREGAVVLTMTAVGRDVTSVRRRVEGEGSPWTQYVVPLTAENCPWYRRTQVEAWRREAALMPLSYEQRIEGAWDGATVDRLFTGVSEQTFGDPEPGEWRVLVGLDHGERERHQSTALILSDPLRQRWHLLDVLNPETRTTILQDAEGLIQLLARHGLTLGMVDRVTGDVNSAGKGDSAADSGRKINDLLEVELRALWPSWSGHVETARKGPGSVRRGESAIAYGLAKGRITASEPWRRALTSYNGRRDSSEAHNIDAARYALDEELDLWFRAVDAAPFLMLPR